MSRILGWFREGSLFKRTLVYVVTLLLGSAAFVSIASLVLISFASSALPRRPAPGSAAAAAAAAAAAEADDEGGESMPGKPRTVSGGVRHQKRNRMNLPLGAAAE